MTDIAVALGNRSYTISIAPGLLGEAGQRLGELTRARKVAVVADRTVADLHLPRLRAALADFDVHPILLPPGEATKDFRHLEKLIDHLLDMEVTRSDILLALGGGVVGDLAGFAASIVKRGMRFIQVPTTLLAMVDSSVGGKTAINTRHGKNLVGAFYQPVAVWADLDVLKTLPPREMAAGYAEVIKYGLINDAGFFAWCEANGKQVLAGDSAALAHAVATSCQAKAAIVAADERETDDIRALLNLGHTFGHALEAETGFSGQLLHGEAVAIGMAQALRFSVAQGLCPASDAERYDAHLHAVGMKARPAEAGIAPDAAGHLVRHMLHDKKMTSDGLPFILLRGIGEAFVAKDVPLDAVRAFLSEDLAR
ncbi:MAG: 3-dehydroquinate synthase [Sphingomonadaceae bacterium]